MRALFIGRFQPLHLGHIEAIQYIFEKKEFTQVIIIIGSAQESYKLENPFTASERFEMLLEALKEQEIHPFKYIIVPLIDINNFNQWFAYLVSMVPSFTAVYTNNPIVQTLVKAFSSIKYFSIPLRQRNSYSSTEIRNRIINSESWENLVPVSVKKLIFKFKGINRLKSLTKTDNP